MVHRRATLPTQRGQSGPPGAAAFTETIKRIASYGSPVRTLYSEQKNCNQSAVVSNIVSDGSFLYWLGPTGLMKLSTDANPGDAPQLVNALVTPPGEVADGGDKIFVIHHNTGGSNTQVSYVLKSNNQNVFLATPGNYAGNLKFDGTYVYYVVAGNLIRQNPGVDGGITIASGVSGYYPQGLRFLGCTINPLPLFLLQFRLSLEKGASVYIYNNLANTLGTAIYTSVDNTAWIYELATDFSHLVLLRAAHHPLQPEPLFRQLFVRAAAHRPQRGCGGRAVYLWPDSVPGAFELEDRRDVPVLAGR